LSLKPASQGTETDADGCLIKLIGVAVIVKLTEFILIYSLCFGGVFLYFEYFRKCKEVLHIEYLASRRMLH